MCLIVLAHRVVPEVPLLVLANRDEYYARPSAALGPWPEIPGLLAGRDLAAGGTWFGVSEDHRWAAVTNIRDGAPAVNEARSRGWLVRDYLAGRHSAERYCAALASEADSYAGFNLLLGEAGEVYYWSNREGAMRRLAPGLYGLSNHRLDTPWPKVRQIKQRLQNLLHERRLGLARLMHLMGDTTLAADGELPETGVPRARERALSAVFIRTAAYGTRGTTLLVRGDDGRGQVVERRYSGSPNAWAQTRYPV